MHKVTWTIFIASILFLSGLLWTSSHEPDALVSRGEIPTTQAIADREPVSGLVAVDAAPQALRVVEESEFVPSEPVTPTTAAADERRMIWEKALAKRDPSFPISDLRERNLAKLSRSVLRFQDMLASDFSEQSAIEREARMIVALSLLASKAATAPLYESMPAAREAAGSGRVMQVEGVYFALGVGESSLYEELRERRSRSETPFSPSEIERIYSMAEEALGWLE